MSEYEGLNLVQLLDRMHDVVEPAAVSWLPQTDGWWVLLAWSLLLLVLAVLKLVQYRRRNAYRREALAELGSITAAADPSAAAAIAGLVKRTALTVFPRTEVAALYGDAWADFLRTSGGNDPEIDAAATAIARAAYAPDNDMETIVRGAERWIRRHRA